MGEALSVFMVKRVDSASKENSTELTSHLQSALEHSLGEFDAEDLVDQFYADKLQIWLILKGANLVGMASTQVVEYARFNALRVVTLSGRELKDWMRALFETLVQFCEEQGLRRIEAVGRRGLVRSLEPLGFAEAYTTVVREV